MYNATDFNENSKKNQNVEIVVTNLIQNCNMEVSLWVFLKITAKKTKKLRP